jgi:hypothetical protein
MRSRAWLSLGPFLSLLWAWQFVVAQLPNQDVVPLGEFSDMKVKGEHCSGHALQIWKSGEKLYGLFLACEGLAGDTPTGLLEQTKWVPETGQLSFTARLTLGSDVLQSGKQVPSKNEFSFKGALKETFMDGALSSIDKAVEGTELTTTSVHMVKRKSDMRSFPDYRRWKIAADRVLQVRGPKW